MQLQNWRVRSDLFVATIRTFFLFPISFSKRMSFVSQIITFATNYVKEDPGSVLFILIVFSIGIGALANIPVSFCTMYFKVEHIILIEKE